MKFGSVILDNAVGAILAHGVPHADGAFKKGRVLSVADVKLLQAEGHETVVAAVLEVDDVPEDVAAHQVAVAICGGGVKAQQAFTGRANLYSIAPGLVVVDAARLNAINQLHESLTMATVPTLACVTANQMLATIKVIPFAVPRSVVDRAMAIIGHEPLIRVAAFGEKRAGLVISRLAQTKPSIIAKSEASIRDRLRAMNSDVKDVVVCDHAPSAIAAAIAALSSKNCDPILVFGASAIVDRADVVPAALEEAGGRVVHLGMPVDPGNLLMLGEIGGTPVIGVPSCARSPKTNGFDWVLQRVVAGLPVSAADIMAMGVGGLLAEIPSRPSPRDNTSLAPRVAAIVLAAGSSSRMRTNKMLADFRGQPMVRASVANIVASSVSRVVVVTGHEQGKVESVLADLPVQSVHNPFFADGLSTSLRCGLQAVADDADAVIICLADMPLVQPALIDKLIAAFNPTEHRSIIVPTHKGQLGNPVLWGREHFVRLMALEGDRGARQLVTQFKSDAVEIDAGSDAVLRDADTPEALAHLGL